MNWRYFLCVFDGFRVYVSKHKHKLELKQHFIFLLFLSCHTSPSSSLLSSVLSPLLPLSPPLLCLPLSPPRLLSPHPQAVISPGTPATPTTTPGTPRRSAPCSCPWCWWVTTPGARPATRVRPPRTAGTPSYTTAASTTSSRLPSLSSSTGLRSTRSSCSLTRKSEKRCGLQTTCSPGYWPPRRW